MVLEFFNTLLLSSQLSRKNIALDYNNKEFLIMDAVVFFSRITSTILCVLIQTRNIYSAMILIVTFIKK